MKGKRKHKFYVSTGHNEEVVEGRDSAVKQAKNASSSTFRDVTVERADGEVRMTFRSGSLETMVSEAGRRRGRR